MTRVGVGIIGCGTIAEIAHMPSYRKTPECKIIAVADTVEERVKSLAERFGIEKAFTDYSDLLQVEDIQAVSVCTPPSTHSAIVKEATNQGKHVLCEKPICLTEKEADEMIRASEENGTILMVGHNLRFLPNHKKALEFIRKGKLGELENVHVRFYGGGPFYEWKTSSNYYLETGSGAGVILNYGIHVFDLLNWFFGLPMNVLAIIGEKRNLPVESTAKVLLKYPTGLSASVDLLYTPIFGLRRAIEIYGIKGYLISELLEPELRFYLSGSLVCKLRGEIPIRFKGDSYLAEIRHFVDCVRHRRRPIIGAPEGKQALRIVLAALESASTGRSINLGKKVEHSDRNRPLPPLKRR